MMKDEATPKSHPMNVFAKDLEIFGLLISQLWIHRMTTLPYNLRIILGLSGRAL